MDAVGDDHIFATLPTAVAGFARWHESVYGTLPAGIPEAAIVAAELAGQADKAEREKQDTQDNQSQQEPHGEA